MKMQPALGRALGRRGLLEASNRLLAGQHENADATQCVVSHRNSTARPHGKLNAVTIRIGHVN